ncbi:MAG TPA: hypothetical protein PLD27_05625 [bacterium]|nr:hypothetical protein [bacterium]HOL47935.1 hypothetical protein [bacterium]HPQ19400.1 hypothetical protein [bacterium]
MQKVKHIIIEGLPATGKTEISNVLKIYFPLNIRILPELTTTIVRENKMNILDDRTKMTELLKKYLELRNEDINRLKEDFVKLNRELIIFEESHLGVHWAYSKVINDEFFLQEYEKELKNKTIEPDFYIRLYISPELSYQRQLARNTPDVEVTADIIEKMYNYLKEWHKTYSQKKVYEINADRSPDVVIKDILKILGITYSSNYKI